MFVKCRKCGWIHMGWSLGTVEESIRQFNSMYIQLTVEQQAEYYNSNPARLKDYQHCFKCNETYKQMEIIDCNDARLSKIRERTFKLVLLPHE